MADAAAKPAARRKSDRTAFLALPLVAQIYVIGVTVLGGASSRSR